MNTNKLSVIINEVYEKYKDNHAIIEKIDKYISHLPIYIDSVCVSITKRTERQEFIINLKETILNEFVHTPFTHYFYIPSSKLYITYDGTNYENINEDTIVVRLYKKINENPYSKQYKKKFKNTIMKNIREINFFSSIPESITIQNILKFFTNIFCDKYIAKYFLTIIGDIVNKKKNNNDECNIYFIPEHFKKFIDILSVFYTDLLFPFKNNTNLELDNYFKIKNHESFNNNNCRLIPYQKNFYIDDSIINFVKINYLNILGVSNYYSNRYNSSDDYLNTNHNDYNFYINYMKNNNENDIVNDFIHNYIIIVPNIKHNSNEHNISSSPSQESNFTIPFNEIFYLWKEYLNEKNYPSNIISNSSFKQNLNIILKNNFDTQNNKYFNITSSYLSYIKSFQEFWNYSMIKKDNQNDLEISEVIMLFSIWCNINNKTKIKNNEEKFIALIEYFYDTNIITDDKKYICNMYCSLWDKKKDIEIYYLLSSYNNNNTPIIKRYKEYCDLIKNGKINNYKLIMNKKYFEELLIQYINNNKTK
jgi:hypothetical protein